MRAFKITMGIINSICLIIVCLLTAIALPTFDLGFYSREYDRYNIPESIEVEKGELMHVTEYMLEYLKDKNDDLVVYANVGGVQREFFNSLEKSHMIDVKNLFLAGFSIRTMTLCGFLCTIFLMFMLKVNPWPVVAVAARAAAVSVVIIFLVAAGVVIMDFERAFTIFHLIFFDNDMWILNPQTDLLINIVPLPFFMDISKTIAFIFFGFIAGIIILSTVYIRRLKHLL